MSRTQAGHGHHRYTRESVERALTLHLGAEGTPRGWTRRGDGYVVPTGVGVLPLRTLREAYIFVVAMADKERRLAESEAAEVAALARALGRDVPKDGDR